MEKSSFDKLIDLLGPKLRVDMRMADLRGGAILPEVCLFASLRFLAGRSYLDVSCICGISPAAFYYCVWKRLIAICDCKELAIEFPATCQELRRAAAGFEDISPRGAIKNCIGVLDGYLARTTTPRSSVVGNVNAYFNGHYQHHGVNVQAIADHL